MLQSFFLLWWQLFLPSSVTGFSFTVAGHAGRGGGLLRAVLPPPGERQFDGLAGHHQDSRGCQFGHVEAQEELESEKD